MARLVCIWGLAIVLLACAACKQETPRHKDNQAVTKTEDKSTSSEVATTAWPPLKENEPVEIASELTAKNYYVVLDCSGSMGDIGCSDNMPKLNVAKTALSKFVNLVPANANLGLMVFHNDQINELIPLGKDNRDQFVNAAYHTSNGGGTPLFAAIRQAYLQMEIQGRKQLGYGEYTLVIVTDGKASNNQDPTEIVHWILGNSPIQIHTIGFCIGKNHSLNIQGRTVYKAADNPDQLDKGLKDVLAESEIFDISDFNKD